MARPNPDATEEPTPRRLDDARKQGDVARSADFTSGAALVAASATVLAVGGGAVARLAALVRAAVTQATSATPPAPAAALTDAALTFGTLILPVVGAAAGAALAVGLLQTGGLVSFGSLAPDLARVSPFAGLARLASREAAMGLLRAAAKAVLVLAIAWWSVRAHVGDALRLSSVAAPRALTATTAVAGTLLLRVAIAVLVVGALDLVWQRRAWRRRHRMTRDEIKREVRESEGDPHHKAARKRLHRELTEHRMVESVARARCVIVNPDHVAVALAWDEASMGAPQIVAKGEELAAERIKAVARQHGVPIYRDVGLARALVGLEVGAEIPDALFEAVAEVLKLLAEERGA